jgi:5-methylcytosine-specific restriction endonuclease McrA
LKSKKKPTKKRASPKEWTDARRHSFIVSALRYGSRRWPPRFEVLEEAKTEKKINKATGRMAQHYLCATCCNEFSATGVQVDHIEPIVDPQGFTTWDVYIEKMFCGKENLQVLCKACHALKTKLERKK